MLIFLTFVGRMLWHYHKFGRINNDSVKFNSEKHKTESITEQQQFDVFTEFSKVQDSTSKLKRTASEENMELPDLPMKGTRNKNKPEE